MRERAGNGNAVAAEPDVARLTLVLTALSLLLLALLAVAAAPHRSSGWRATERRYDALAQRRGVAPIAVAIREIRQPALDVVDRCTSCHVAMAGGAAPLADEPLFAAHPALPHDPLALGCTVCHGGDGRATTVEAAHGTDGRADTPLLARDDVEAGCGTCHAGLRVPDEALAARGRALVEEVKCDACHGRARRVGPDLATIGLHGFRADWHRTHVEAAARATSGPFADVGFVPLADAEVAAVTAYLRSLVGAPALVRAKTLAHRRGCRGCHTIDGVGGDEAPDLSDVGRRRDARWLTRHFLDPARVSPGSVMPKLAVTVEEARLLTRYALSLRARPLPEAWTPRDRVRVTRLGERDFPTDGESLFAGFCVGCHGRRGEGRKQVEPPLTFPAILAPDFLAVADDAFLRRTLLDGRPGRRMPAWGTRPGGLRREEVDALVAFLRARAPAAPDFTSVMAIAVERGAGAAVFATRCAMCHGARGEGSAVAPPLAARDSPVARDPARIFATVENGVAGTAMGSFRRLDARSLRALVAFVGALPAVEAKRTGWTPARGDATRGRARFAAHCARCHGPAADGKEGPALANHAFLAAAGDGFLAATILRGRDGTAMPRFGEPARDHARLAPGDVADVVAWLRSLAPGPSR